MGSYAFREIQASWGIAIDLVAELSFAKSAPPGAGEVTPSLYVVFAPELTLPPVDRECITSGLRRMSGPVDDHRGEAIAVVEVKDVQYGPADYQPEGLEAAIIGWLCETLECEPPPVDISFDGHANRYVFDYDGAAQPPEG